MISQEKNSKLSGLEGYYAGFVSRLIAFIVDLLIINFCILFLSWIISIFVNLFNFSSTLGYSIDILAFYQTIVSFITSPLIIFIFIISFIFFYNVFFWMFSGHTPGKSLLGLRVIPKYGGKMSFSRSTVRFFAYVPSILSLGIGFLSIIFDDQRQAWQDSIAQTYVVYSWNARMDETFLREYLDKR